MVSFERLRRLPTRPEDGSIFTSPLSFLPRPLEMQEANSSSYGQRLVVFSSFFGAELRRQGGENRANEDYTP